MPNQDQIASSAEATGALAADGGMSRRPPVAEQNRGPNGPRIDIAPEELYVLQVEELYHQVWLSIGGGIVAAVFVSFVLWDAVPHARMGIWLGCLAVYFTVRMMIIRGFRRARSRGEQILRWGMPIEVACAVIGLLWGSTAIFLFPRDSTFHQGFLTLIVIGLSVGSLYTHAAMKRVQILYLVPSLGLFTARFFYEGGQAYTTVGAMMLVLSVGMFWAAHRVHVSVIKSLKARHAQDILTRSLAEQKTRTEQLNVGLAAEILERRRAEEELRLARDNLEERVEQRTRELRAALTEKEVLLREIHHRVKNNLQVMSSMLAIQSSYMDQPFQQIFKDTHARLWSMALVHEGLYGSANLAEVRADGYVRGLLMWLASTYQLAVRNVELDTHIEDVTLQLDTAVPFGMIVSELFTNCVKHAFPEGRQGVISLTLRSVQENELELEVSDNGIGMPEDLDVNDPQSFGLDLVNTLVEQLHAEMEVDRRHGTQFRIRFKETPMKMATHEDALV